MRVRLLLIVVAALPLVIAAAISMQDDSGRRIRPALPCPSDWEVVHGEYGGEVTRQAYLTFTHTPATGNRLWVFAEVQRGIVVHHQWAEYQLRPAATPPEIDFRDRKGIYVLDGDDLKVCFGAPDKRRPRDFRTAKGDEQLLLVLKRRRE